MKIQRGLIGNENMAQKINTKCFRGVISLGVSMMLISVMASSAAKQKGFAKEINRDLKTLSRSIFDISSIQKLTGTKFDFIRRGSITSEEIYRSFAPLRAPYTKVEYEKRSSGRWAGLTLFIDEDICISPSDLEEYFPLSEGVMRESDHLTSDDFIIGYGSDKREIWITFRGGKAPECAKTFAIEASR